MQGISLLKNAQVVKAFAAVGAGSSDSVGTVIDATNAESVLVNVQIGTLTAGQVTSLELYGATASDGSDSAAFATPVKTAAMADADSNKILALEIVRPTKPYLVPVVHRATQNAVIVGGTAVVTNNRVVPITQSTAVSKSSVFVETT